MQRVKPLAPPTGLWSAEQVAALGPEHDHCELWDGHMRVAEPAGLPSAVVNGRLIAIVGQHVRTRELGEVLESSAGFLLRRGPDRLLAPDLAFVARERLPQALTAGFPELVPDLVAEVRSPSQSWEQTLARGGIWIAHGVRVVWLIDPLGRRAVELRPNSDALLHTDEGALDGAPVLPELTVSLAELLRGYGR